MGRKAKHTKVDWIVAAFKTLGEEGIEGVRVERLAKDLGTTKGSFYWHFADRPALHKQMLDFWEQEGTKRIIIELDDTDLSPNEQLRALAQTAVQTEIMKLDTIAIEGALRAWAGQEGWVADRIRTAENARVEYVEQLLLSIGHNPIQATLLANQLYLMLLGFYSISRHDPKKIHRDAFIAFADQIAEDRSL
ncbi:TetR/AcrR family transcriptional regulator [Maritalea sp.]|uniref:TetR/AcrR family transcriptional regulator n=1 Tax=Maritalea sp. TaxID=2003361 RepID=UPI003EF5A128